MKFKNPFKSSSKKKEPPEAPYYVPLASPVQSAAKEGEAKEDPFVPAVVQEDPSCVVQEAIEVEAESPTVTSTTVGATDGASSTATTEIHSNTTTATDSSSADELIQICSHILALQQQDELEEEQELQELEQLRQDVMTEFAGVSVQDLKRLFNNSSQSQSQTPVVGIAASTTSTSTTTTNPPPLACATAIRTRNIKVSSSSSSSSLLPKDSLPHKSATNILKSPIDKEDASSAQPPLLLEPDHQTQQQFEELQQEKAELQKVLSELELSLQHYKAQSQKHQAQVQVLLKECVEPLQAQVQSLRGQAGQLERQVTRQSAQVKELEQDNVNLKDKLQQRDRVIANLLESSPHASSSSVEDDDLEEKEKEENPCDLPLLPEPSDDNDHDNDTQQYLQRQRQPPQDALPLPSSSSSSSCPAETAATTTSVEVSLQDQKQIQDLQHANTQLETKLQEQVLATQASQLLVIELEETVATQQLQIESLSIVNRELEQQQQQQQQGATTATKATGKGRGSSSFWDSDSCESVVSSVAAETDDLSGDNDHHKEPSSSDPITTADDTVQEDLTNLFRSLGTFNKNTNTNTNDNDKVMNGDDSIGQEVQLEEEANHETSDIIYEADLQPQQEDHTPSYNDDLGSSKIEEFEAAWMQQASLVQAIQRDQEELLSRLRDSSSDKESKLLTLSNSIDSEEDNCKKALEQDNKRLYRELQDLHSQSKSKIQALERENKEFLRKLQESPSESKLQALEQENKELLHKLQESQSESNAKLQSLQEQLKLQTTLTTITKELESSPEEYAAAMLHDDELRTKNASLTEQVTNLLERLKTSERTRDEQKAFLSQLERDHHTTWQDLQLQKSLVLKTEEITAQQRETMACLKNEKLAMEEAYKEQKARTKEMEGVVNEQKATVDGLHRKINQLTKRLLETEGEFRKHLIGNLDLHSRMEELRSRLAAATETTAEETCNTTKSKETTRGDLSGREVSVHVSEVSLETTSLGGGDLHNAPEDDAASQEVESSKGNDCASSCPPGDEEMHGEEISKDDDCYVSFPPGDEEIDDEEKVSAEELLRLLSFAVHHDEASQELESSKEIDCSSPRLPGDKERHGEGKMDSKTLLRLFGIAVFGR